MHVDGSQFLIKESTQKHEQSAQRLTLPRAAADAVWYVKRHVAGFRRICRGKRVAPHGDSPTIQFLPASQVLQHRLQVAEPAADHCLAHH